MLAIPVHRARVAPVFNWCSRVLLFPEDARDCSQCREEVETISADSIERLAILRRKGVNVLICGALSPELLHYAENLDLKIICGVAGDISEVLGAYQEHKLDEPRFWLPGCQGRRCYRGGCYVGDSERRCTMPGGQGRGLGQGQGQGKGQGRGGRMGGRGAGPGGDCICPNCGNSVPHERGIPCTQMKCPKCGTAMTR